jgi:hypothetical protein
MLLTFLFAQVHFNLDRYLQHSNPDIGELIYVIAIFDPCLAEKAGQT